jgi:hypothetical protein
MVCPAALILSGGIGGCGPSSDIRLEPTAHKLDGVYYYMRGMEGRHVSLYRRFRVSFVPQIPRFICLNCTDRNSRHDQ